MRHLLPLLLLPLFLTAQTEIRLYDGVAPGSENWDWEEGAHPFKNGLGTAAYNVTTPTLTAYLPEAGFNTETAMIIAPGGGFHYLAMDHEGHEVARALQREGVAAFVLKYRTVKQNTTDPETEIGTRWPDRTQFMADNAALLHLATQDGMRALEYVRANAERYGINPARVGMMGFSAGGNLTLSVAKTANPPDFIAPIYAWDGVSVGRYVPEGDSPVFLAVAEDDGLDLSPHAIDIYQRWTRAGHPVSLHLYPDGGHGFGARRNGKHADFWMDDLLNWLTANRYLMPQSSAEKMDDERFAGHLAWHRMFDEKMQNDFGHLDRYRAANERLGAPAAAEQRVVFIGNSITEGWYGQDSAWFQRNNFIGRGISGQTSPQLLVRFRQDVIDLQPAAVVIFIGTNDVARNTGYIAPEQTAANIFSMAELARANGIEPIIASVLPADEFPWRRGLEPAPIILRINEMLRDYAEEHDITYLDFHSAMKNDRDGLDTELAYDGVHPTLLGYQKFMEPLAEQAVRAALK